MKRNKSIILSYLMMFTLTSCCHVKKEYYPHLDGGGKKTKYIYHVNVISGKKCGQFVWLAEPGDTIEVSNFKNDKLNGFSKFYFDNGYLQLEIECVNDMKHGITREFYENKQLRCKLVYNMNRLWKIEEVYDSIGNPLDYGTLVEGNGFVKIFYPNGQLEQEGRFKEGVKSGHWRYYTNTGNMLDSTEYKDGYREGSITIESMY